MFSREFLSIALSLIMTISPTKLIPEPVIIHDTKPLVNDIVIEETVDGEEPIEVTFVETPVVEPVEETVVEETVVEQVEYELPLTDEEIDLMALVTMAEAEGECEEGRRLVIDVILNRVDSPRFPDTVHGVIYARNQFECMTNGRVDRCYVMDEIRQLVVEELQSRTNDKVYYFRTDHYHNFGTPVVQVGRHYFSTT